MDGWMDGETRMQNAHGMLLLLARCFVLAGERNSVDFVMDITFKDSAPLLCLMSHRALPTKMFPTGTVI
jgi:hypothetical protein